MYDPELIQVDLHSPPKSHDFSREINRMLTAAIINNQFRYRLLKDPKKAIKNGYCGETFNFNSEEISLILSIQADDLQSFAGQILNRQYKNTLREVYKPSGFSLPVPAITFVNTA